MPAAEHRQISDTEYKQFTDTIIDKLIDAERVTSLVLKDLAAATAASSTAALATVAAAAAAPIAENHQGSSRQYGCGFVMVDENFVADAAAEELRERLQELAKQVVHLQVSPAAQMGVGECGLVCAKDRFHMLLGCTSQHCYVACGHCSLMHACNSLCIPGVTGTEGCFACSAGSTQGSHGSTPRPIR